MKRLNQYLKPIHAQLDWSSKTAYSLILPMILLLSTLAFPQSITCDDFPNQTCPDYNIIPIPEINNVEVGDTFTVVLRLEPQPGAIISVADIHMMFDPALVNVLSCDFSPGQPLSSPIQPTVIDNNDGFIRINSYAQSIPVNNIEFDYIEIEFIALSVGSTTVDHIFSDWALFPFTLLAYGGYDITGTAVPIKINISAPGIPDCNGDIGGTAYIDDCETCVGGYTGLEACDYDCIELLSYIGDNCDDNNIYTENDVITADCNCEGIPVEPAECQKFVYYIADYVSGQGTSIYEVEFVNEIAEMTFVIGLSDEVHIAYNSEQNVIYAVSKDLNQYHILNPHSEIPTISGPFSLSGTYPQITGAVFSADGEFLITSQSTRKIYSVNVTTNSVSVYDDFAPIRGGDIAADSEGNLYLNTNHSGGRLYQVHPQSIMDDVLITAISGTNTGMAITDSDQLILSMRNTDYLTKVNADGTDQITFDLYLNGDAFILGYGDMASGCFSNVDDEPVEEICESWITFYAQYDASNNETDIYTVDFNVGVANLELYTSTSGNASIGFDENNGVLHLVTKTSTFDNGITLKGITAAEFNPNDGKLYIGDYIKNAIYSVDINTGVAEYYASGFVHGGDLAITPDGSIYLATQSGNSLYEINNAGGSDFISGIPSQVTGASATNTENGILLSNKGSIVFTEVSALDGSIIDSYPIIHNGAPFTTDFGDLASGCFVQNGAQATLMSVGFTTAEPSTELTSLPNPTSGPSQVVFTSANTTRTLIGVYDMTGRNVATLFNQEAIQGQEYRLNFDGSFLPNGVYIYKLTNDTETIIKKFMIAR